MTDHSPSGSTTFATNLATLLAGACLRLRRLPVGKAMLGGQQEAVAHTKRQTGGARIATAGVIRPTVPLPSGSRTRMAINCFSQPAGT
jgi:hypothetical protein